MRELGLNKPDGAPRNLARAIWPAQFGPGNLPGAHGPPDVSLRLLVRRGGPVTDDHPSAIGNPVAEHDSAARLSNMGRLMRSLDLRPAVR